MKIRKVIAGVMMLATAAGSSYLRAQVDHEEQSEERNQCYRREGLDPPMACTSCFNICLGTGYICCKIVVEE